MKKTDVGGTRRTWCATAVLLTVANCAPANEPVYIDDSSQRAFTEKQYVEVLNDVDRYARSSKLNALTDRGRDEIRFWVTSANFNVNTIGYDTVGYVFSGRRALKCRITYLRSKSSPIQGRCNLDRRPTKSAPVLAALGDLAKLSHRNLGCGVMDGAWVDVDGVSNGHRFIFSSNNPGSCNDAASALVAKVLANVW